MKSYRMENVMQKSSEFSAHLVACVGKGKLRVFSSIIWLDFRIEAYEIKL